MTDTGIAPKGTKVPTEMSSSPEIIQQSQRDGDDAKVGANVQPGRHASGFQESQATKDRKEYQNCDKAKRGPRLGTAQQAADSYARDDGLPPFG